MGILHIFAGKQEYVIIMKRIIAFILMTTIFGLTAASAESYDKLWKRIEQLQKDDRPQSVREAAEQVAKKALRERCFPQYVKARATVMQSELDLNPDAFDTDSMEREIFEGEKMARLLKGASAGQRRVAEAVLHLVAANIYNVVSQSYIHDYDATDFRELISNHLDSSFADMQLLAQTDNKAYVPLVERRRDGDLFSHDMLSLMLEYAQGLDNVRQDEERWTALYEQATRIYTGLNMREAATLTRLKLLALRSSAARLSVRLDHSDYLAALRRLYDETAGLKTRADVAVAIARQLSDDDESLLFVHRAIRELPASPRVDELRNIETELLRVRLSCNISSRGDQTDYTISYHGTDHATLTVLAYNGKTDGRLRTDGQLVIQQQLTLGDAAVNARRKADGLPVRGEHKGALNLAPGRYVVQLESEGVTTVHSFSITTLCTFVLTEADRHAALVRVLDCRSGKPVAGASLLCYRGYADVETPDSIVTVDAQGEAVIPYGSFRRIMAIRDVTHRGQYLADQTDAIYLYDRGSDPFDRENTQVQAYTDRSIYRPGQTIHLALLAYSVRGDESHVLKDCGLTVSLLGPDWKKVSDVEVRTNDMGSATADISLPEGCKLGAYNINVKGDGFSTSETIYVEEYKRPTFEVLMDKACEQNDDEGFSTLGVLGDTLLISGQALAYSGVPIQGGSVTLRASWSEDGWFFMTRWQQLGGDLTATTDAEGRFLLRLPAVPEEKIWSRAVRLRLTVTVADVDGEQQTTTLLLRVKNPEYTDAPRPEQEESKPCDLLSVTSETFTPDAMPEFCFRAQEDDARIYYYLVGEKGIIDRGYRVLAQRDSLNYVPKYADENGKTLAFVVYYVRNGHECSMSRQIELAQPDKELKLNWSTFRDRLQPGQKEQWTLSVTDSKGRSVSGAELMAVMYDASLDALYPHNWMLNLRFHRQHLYAGISANLIESSCFLWLDKQPELFDDCSWLFDSMVQLIYSKRFYIEDGLMYSAMPKMSLRKGVSASFSAGAVNAADDADGMVEETAVVDEEQTAASAPLRTNLSELAFFMPQVVTDSKGRAQLSFTLPDCLTEWKVMCLAHTADMHHGTLTAKATASRDFMVQPNMPRFLRQGDKAVVTAKVQNLCNHAVGGTAMLRLLSAADETVVAVVKEDFSVEMGKTASVRFALDASMPAGDYICEVTATDGKVQDGERNRLPVLSVRRRVVENIPFFGDYDESKIDKVALFNGNSPTATDRVYELSQMPDAAHLVFQSLRALEVPEHDNAPALAAAIYTNVVLAEMSKEITDGIAGFSVVEAQQRADKAQQKLTDTQLGSGAFPWFKGMDESVYMTLAVAEHLCHLADYVARHNLALDVRIMRMLKRALKYLDTEELRRYREAKKNGWQLHLSESTMRYLHIATNADSALVKDYLDLLEKDFPNTTMYGRAKGVLLLQKYGRTAAAQRFLQSLKEYTVYREGFGRYFATDQAYYSWQDYRVPTQVAVIKAIGSLTASGPLPTSPQGGGDDSHVEASESQMINEMLLWLLRQKQTQVWENPLNAIDVAQLLLDNDRMPRVSWGYVHTEYTEDESKLDSYTTGELTIQRSVIRRDNGHITVRHTIHADRDMDFVSVSSDRSADLEPLRQLSGYQRVGTRWGYVELHDSSTTFFFDHFTAGTTTIDLDCYVARPGTYSAGISEVRCEYAPEFGARSK